MPGAHALPLEDRLARFYLHDACVDPGKCFARCRLRRPSSAISFLNGFTGKHRSCAMDTTTLCKRKSDGLPGEAWILAAGAWSSRIPLNRHGNRASMPASFPVKPPHRLSASCGFLGRSWHERASLALQKKTVGSLETSIRTGPGDPEGSWFVLQRGVDEGTDPQVGRFPAWYRERGAGHPQSARNKRMACLRTLSEWHPVNPGDRPPCFRRDFGQPIRTAGGRHSPVDLVRSIGRQDRVNIIVRKSQ